MTRVSNANERIPRTIHQWLTLVLQGIIMIGLAFSIFERQWLNAAIIIGILVLTLLPRHLGRRFDVYIPPEFDLTAIAFIFAALFLGETRDFYGRFWWWDVALHTTSGGLLGVLGVLLVYVMNETPRIELRMKPGFVAFFAFCFAMSVGAVWEVFEFAMDSWFGLNMQKSGLVDTMWDLIVDAFGAATISITGYVYMRRGAPSWVERWIQRFVENNPRLFGKPR